MSCENCKNRECEKNGKPCNEVENILKKEKIYRRNWIRRRFNHGGKIREMPFSALCEEDLKLLDKRIRENDFR